MAATRWELAACGEADCVIRDVDASTGTLPAESSFEGSADPVIFGYTTGVYDMFHVGHLVLLERAKERCDRLIVGVTTDELSLAQKGKVPIVSFNERRRIVAALRCVDITVPQTSMDKRAAWENLRFDRMFVGDDWRGTDRWNALEREFGELGVEIVYFAYTDTTSSTRLRGALDKLHGEEQ